MLKKNALVTATLADTEGVPVINLAHTISEKFKCTDFDKEDEDAFSFTCKNGNTTTESLVTPGDEGKYVVITVTYKDEEGLKQGKEFIKNMLK